MLNLGQGDIGYFTLKNSEPITGLQYDPQLIGQLTNKGLNCAKNHTNSQELVDEFKRVMKVRI